MAFIDTNSTVGIIIDAYTTNVTGSIYLTFFLILLFLIVFAFAGRLDTLPFLLSIFSLVIVLAIAMTNFLLVLGIIALVFAGVLIKFIFSLG